MLGYRNWCHTQPPGDLEQSISDQAENLWAYVTCNSKIYESCRFFDLLQAPKLTGSQSEKELPASKFANSQILATFCRIPVKIRKKICPNGLKIDERT